MEADLRRQKLDLVWASVFPAVFAMWGLTMLIGNDGGDGAELMALLMASGLFLAVLTASILLLFGGSGCGRLWCRLRRSWLLSLCCSGSGGLGFLLGL